MRLRPQLVRLFRQILAMTDDEIAGLKSCLRLLKNYRWKFLFLIISSLGVSLFEVGTMAILILAINLIIEDGTLNAAAVFGLFGEQITELGQTHEEGVIFVLLVLVAVGLQISKSALQYCCAALGIRLGVSVTKDLQSRITEKIMQVEYSTIAAYPSGHLGSLIAIGGSTPRVIITNVLGIGLPCVLLLVFYTGLMFSLSVALTMYALGIAFLLLFGMRTVVSRLEDLGGAQTLRTLAAGRITIEFLNMPRLMRLFNIQKEVKKKLDRARTEVLMTNQRSSLLMARVDPAIQVVTISGIGAFLAGGYIFAGDSFKAALPSLLVFLVIFNRLMPQLRLLNTARMTFANNKRSLGPIGAFLALKERERSRCNLLLTGTGHRIVFDEVSLIYPGAHSAAVKNISLELGRGKILALVGPSGSGKTTIADLLGGLYQPTSGEIRIDGAPLSDIDSERWAQCLGAVDQGIEMLDATIRENILFARAGFQEEELILAAQEANADEFIRKLDSGYETLIGPKGYQLSGGQQQRIALARALLGNPEILILDEATSALDTESEKLITQTLRIQRENHAILIIAHRLSSVVAADEILVLDNGEVVERGTFHDLMKEDGAFAKVWALQTAGYKSM